MRTLPEKPIKPGSRPTRKTWCRWLEAMVTWTPAERKAAWDKAHKAWQSRSIRAQYAAMGEMTALEEQDRGEFKHENHCTCASKRRREATLCAP